MLDKKNRRSNRQGQQIMKGLLSPSSLTCRAVLLLSPRGDDFHTGKPARKHIRRRHFFLRQALMVLTPDTHHPPKISVPFQFSSKAVLYSLQLWWLLHNNAVTSCSECVPNYHSEFCIISLDEAMVHELMHMPRVQNVKPALLSLEKLVACPRLNFSNPTATTTHETNYGCHGQCSCS
jgi:hypothetical protein